MRPEDDARQVIHAKLRAAGWVVQNMAELNLTPGPGIAVREFPLKTAHGEADCEGKPASCSFASYLIRVQIPPGVGPRFLARRLEGGLGRSWTRRVANQTVGQANVNGTKVGRFPFPPPPLAEQGEIVAIMEDKLSIIEPAEQTAPKQLRRAAPLRQSIQKRAFQGSLLPQDANDEPGDKLLERIHARSGGRAPGLAGTRQRPRKGRIPKPVAGGHD